MLSVWISLFGFAVMLALTVSTVAVLPLVLVAQVQPAVSLLIGLLATALAAAGVSFSASRSDTRDIERSGRFFDLGLSFLRVSLATAGLLGISITARWLPVLLDFELPGSGFESGLWALTIMVTFGLYWYWTSSLGRVFVLLAPKVRAGASPLDLIRKIAARSASTAAKSLQNPRTRMKRPIARRRYPHNCWRPRTNYQPKKQRDQTSNRLLPRQLKRRTKPRHLEGL